ncbi:MAG TPA: glycine--tRNA ligase subunit beta [Vicinamibacterales bacterium]|jgi:glycyl-tRNA synthetase beta chain
MERELLLEIGCEELPAGWLPGLTTQIGDAVAAQLREHRLTTDVPVETYSTPRRLTARLAHVAERQTDLEELVTGPPVSAAFKPDGTPTPAAAGFAAKQGVDVGALERTQTPKGEYLAFRNRQRGKAAVDVLPSVLGGVLRAMTFPKSMHWDAMLEDGRGELLFGRPIRWILYLYGGRVVPFSIARTPAAQSSQVQDVPSGAVTYGHRFLTTSGRAGRSIKVRSFEEYRARLLENFVVLERSQRHDKIARALDAKAQRLRGRVSRAASVDSGLLEEVPDLVEYPSVVAGTFAPEFAQELPEEVLVTTLVHHQHYFPVEGEDGRLLPAFLAVINSEPDNEKTISRNAERVVSARLRDARFFWEADRKSTLESRIERLSTLLFHKKLGTYKEKAERLERLAATIARDALGADAAAAQLASQAARLAKADLTTDMVREFTELQGTMGGIYAREERLPEAVWKAIYYHYLPLGVEADAPPSREQLGTAAATWAAVSLADKLDTVVGLVAAGEKPTGSRDPYALRRGAQAIVKLLVDLPEVTGIDKRPTLDALIDAADREHQVRLTAETRAALHEFFQERLIHVLESRGYDRGNVRAVTLNRPLSAIRPLDERRKLEVLPDFAKTAEFQQLATAFKRVRNITRDVAPDDATLTAPDGDALTEPAERALWDEIERRAPVIEQSMTSGRNFREAFSEAAKVGPVVDRFFVDVLVMADDPVVRKRRRGLLKRLETMMLNLADPSEIVSEEKRP